MASVYSNRAVEYHFLIPYSEYYDVSSSGNFTVDASYFEHNTDQYISLTTDVPELTSVKSINEEGKQTKIFIYDTNGVLRKISTDNLAPLQDLPKGFYILKQGAITWKIVK